MKTLVSFAAVVLGIAQPLVAGSSALFSRDAAVSALAGREGALVVIDGADGRSESVGTLVGRKFAPCSTFKVWNTLIGLEAGLISRADEPFYQWDGEKRSIADWNRNLTLKEAFQVSCVPAFQDLARRIGPERMQKGLDAIGYGDRDTSAGIDVFWLPKEGRKTVLITPAEQAELIRRLATDAVPFSAKSQKVLREVMTARSTLRGTLFGKTGSSGNGPDGESIGWYVGYVETNGTTYAFACLLKGRDVMGKDARAVVEAVAEKEGWL